MKIEKDFLSLAAEYRVCSEILKRSLFATITYGNKKAVDIYAIGKKRRTAVVEVKAANGGRFVTSLYQKYAVNNDDCPHFWVLCSIGRTESGFEEQFFILSHVEMAVEQCKRNARGKVLPYAEAAKLFPKGKGVDNVLMKDLTDYEDRWEKIIEFCKT
jgi:hypothetical protein